MLGSRLLAVQRQYNPTAWNVSWRRFMGYVPLEDPGEDSKVKSIFCFVVAPNGNEKALPHSFWSACADAAREGFDIMEAYPTKEHIIKHRISAAT